MMPLSEQGERYLAHADKAIDLMIAYLETHREVIKRRQLLRHATVGVDDYGDQSWHKTSEFLALDLLDELCDGSYYTAISVDQHGFAETIMALGMTDADT